MWIILSGIFLGSKVLYERGCPSVKNSLTKVFFILIAFKVKVIQLTLCIEKYYVMLTIVV